MCVTGKVCITVTGYNYPLDRIIPESLYHNYVNTVHRTYSSHVGEYIICVRIIHNIK